MGNNDELNEEELYSVQAGNSEGMSEQNALEHPDLFRESQIERLQDELLEDEVEEEETHSKHM